MQTAKEKKLDANRPHRHRERLRPYVGDSVQELPHIENCYQDT
jgi:hypothetical protein